MSLRRPHKSLYRDYFKDRSSSDDDGGDDDHVNSSTSSITPQWMDSTDDPAADASSTGDSLGIISTEY